MNVAWNSQRLIKLKFLFHLPGHWGYRRLAEGFWEILLIPLWKLLKNIFLASAIITYQEEKHARPKSELRSKQENVSPMYPYIK